MGEMGIYQMYGRLCRTLGGMFNPTDDLTGAPARLLYVTVDDDGRVAEVIDANGFGAIGQEPVRPALIWSSLIAIAARSQPLPEPTPAARRSSC